MHPSPVDHLPEQILVGEVDDAAPHVAAVPRRIPDLHHPGSFRDPAAVVSVVAARAHLPRRIDRHREHPSRIVEPRAIDRHSQNLAPVPLDQLISDCAGHCAATVCVHGRRVFRPAGRGPQRHDATGIAVHDAVSSREFCSEALETESELEDVGRCWRRQHQLLLQAEGRGLQLDIHTRQRLGVVDRRPRNNTLHVSGTDETEPSAAPGANVDPSKGLSAGRAGDLQTVSDATRPISGPPVALQGQIEVLPLPVATPEVQRSRRHLRRELRRICRCERLRVL